MDLDRELKTRRTGRDSLIAAHSAESARRAADSWPGAGAGVSETFGCV